MGTIADKLAYLGETKSRIRQALNSTGAILANDVAFRSYAAAILNNSRTLDLSFDKESYQKLSGPLLAANKIKETIDFQRSSGGSRVNALGKHEWVPSTRTNYCAAPNVNPVDLTGMTKGGSGAAAAVLSVVDDTAELAAAGLSALCTNGKVFKLDNSAGTSFAWARPDGSAPEGAVTLSVCMRSSGGSVHLDLDGQAPGALSTIPVKAKYERVVATGTATSANRQLRVMTPVGSVVYFVLFQMETGTQATDYIPTTTAAVTVTNHAPRIDYDPVALTGRGLLVEERRVNLLAYSQDFSNAAWSANNAALRHGQVAPDGSASASLAIPSTVDTEHSVGRVMALSADTAYTFTVFMKRHGNAPYGYLRLGRSTTGNNAVFIFDLQTGAALTSLTHDEVKLLATKVQAADGGYWVSLSVRIALTTNHYLQAGATWKSATFLSQGDGTSGAIVWGAQLEQASFPSSYIRTPATFVSRSTTATYIDSTGTLRTAAANVARINHVLIGGQWVSQGLLLEGQATNVVTASDSLSFSLGAGTEYLYDTSGSIAGVPATRATRQDLRYRYLSKSYTTTSPKATVSIFVKAGAVGDYVALRVQAVYPRRADVILNVKTGAIEYAQPAGDAVLKGVKVEPMLEGYRVSITVDMVDQNPGTFYFCPKSNKTVVDSDDVALSVAFFGGVQVEAGEQVTSYISTPSGSQVTRAADASTSSAAAREADVPKLTNFTNWRATTIGTFHMRVLDANKADLLLFGGAPILRGVTGSGTLTIVFATSQTGSVYVDGALAFTFNQFHGLNLSTLADLLLAAQGVSTIRSLKYYPRAFTATDVLSLEGAV